MFTCHCFYNLFVTTENIFVQNMFEFPSYYTTNGKTKDKVCTLKRKTDTNVSF